MGWVPTCRILLGCVEAGFFPSAIFYLTLFYTREEIAKRISIFYMMGFVANAVSGLIAYSVFQWKNMPLYDWQYLFIIEGVMTTVLAICAFMLLPQGVSQSRYFNEEEGKCSKIRLALYTESQEAKFTWRAALLPLFHWQTWMFGAMALGYGVACASISNFLPTIIKRLATNTVRANLLTIAPNISGGLFMVVCWISDRYQQRALCAIGATIISMIGFIVLGTADLVHHTGAGYFCTFLLTFGTFTPAVIVPAWLSSNQSSLSGRATQLGLIAGLQNIGGIISSESFRSQDSPVYAPALIVSACFQGFMILSATGAYLYYRQMNRKLDSGEIAFITGREDYPEFRNIMGGRKSTISGSYLIAASTWATPHKSPGPLIDVLEVLWKVRAGKTSSIATFVQDNEPYDSSGAGISSAFVLLQRFIERGVYLLSKKKARKIHIRTLVMHLNISEEIGEDFDNFSIQGVVREIIEFLDEWMLGIKFVRWDMEARLRETVQFKLFASKIDRVQLLANGVLKHEWEVREMVAKREDIESVRYATL
ncbi:hypothetical protein B7463_g11168, partial [Scytalidium lignicola]